MKPTRVAVYCRANNYCESKIQRMALDRLFFRIAAYAYSHKLLIVSYYEDGGCSGGNYFPGFTELLKDYSYQNFDAVLVSAYEQLPEKLTHVYPFDVLAVDSSERRINYL